MLAQDVWYLYIYYAILHLCHSQEIQNKSPKDRNLLGMYICNFLEGFALTINIFVVENVGLIVTLKKLRL